MEVVISFFRDTLSGWTYFFVVVVSMFSAFVLLGVLGDKKKAEVQKELKRIREDDLREGRSAAKAALEGKQVISAMPNQAPVAATIVQQDIVKTEEAPAVLEISSATTGAATEIK